MKILFLSPKVDAKHKLVDFLGSKSVGVLLANTVEEAFQLLQLHGTSVDLAVIHKEGGKNREGPHAGLSLANKVKSEPTHADLPYVLTFDQWTEAEAAAHQQTPQGANAYLAGSWNDEELLQIIDAVIGSNLEVDWRAMQQKIPETFESHSGIQLEETSQVFKGANEFLKKNSEVSLELPTLELPTAVATSELSLKAPQPVAQSPRLEPTVATDMQGQYVDQAYAPSPDEYVHHQSVTPSPSPDNDLFKKHLGHTKKSPLPPPPPTLTVAPPQEVPAPVFERLPVDRLPVGDSIIPGGAAQTPDEETLKKYLQLREQDVVALSRQLKLARQQVETLEQTLGTEREKIVELNFVVEDFKRRMGEYERTKKHEWESLQSEMNELRFQLKAKSDKVRIMESQVREAVEESEKLKERVRLDIRRIRVREKELENRLELLRKDSEALLAARETKVIELKRKVDLLEFNMDLLQDQYSKEKEISEQLREQLKRVSQAVRVAGGLLEGKEKAVKASENPPSSDVDQQSIDVDRIARSA